MRIAQRLSTRVQRLLKTPDSTADRNTHYLYLEVIFAGFLAAAGSFNAAYVLRLGGSNALVGFMSSLPALVASLLFIPSARVLERRAHYMPWVVASLFLTRLGYVAIVLLPLVTGRFLPELTVAILVVITVPSVFFSTGWSPMLSDVVPPRSRATVLAWRSILSSATIAPLIFIAGRWLDSAPFPMNYQWMYALGWLASGGMGVYLVSRIRMEPLADGAQPPRRTPVDKTRREKGTWLDALRAAADENRGFFRIVVNTLLFNLGAWMVGPLFIIFYVRELGATDGWVGILGTLAHVGVIAGYWLWRRIIRRTGEARSLLIAAPLVCIHPLLVALVPNLTVILFVEFLINVIAAGVNLSHSVIFLELLPEGRKHSSTAVYSMIMNIGAFVCPLIGVALADRIGIAPTLLIGAAMRLAGAALFFLLPVKQTDSQLQVA